MGLINGNTLTEKQQKRDRARLRCAMIWAFELSKDPRRRVGSILVHEDDRQSSLGYNGLATGVPDNVENWLPPLKYELVIHAEMNALDNRSFPAQGGTLFCLLKPCHVCLNRLINNKVSRIVWLETEVEFVNNHDEVWDKLAYEYMQNQGGQLIEYEREPIDNAIHELYAERHDNYGK